MVIVIAILFLMGAIAGVNPSTGDTRPTQPGTSVVHTVDSAPPVVILNKSGCRFVGSNIRDLSESFAMQTADGHGFDCDSH